MSLAVRVLGIENIEDLGDDLAGVAKTSDVKAARVVKKNVEQGSRLARRIARAKSGPHGKNYFKRISGEMTGVTEGEYGPTGDVLGNAVGAGWRNRGPNLDLPQSADIVGPQFARDAGDMLDGLFW